MYLEQNLLRDDDQINLNVLFLLYVIVYCCILHNMILNGKDENIDELMFLLQVENVAALKNGGMKKLDDQINQINELASQIVENLSIDHKITLK